MATCTGLSLRFVALLLFSFLPIYHSFILRQPLWHDDDRYSLLQFKHSFVFDEVQCDPSTDYTKLSSWKVGDDCCSWDGVDCDVQTGRVIGLDLSSSCLYGSINSSSPLFRLVHLKSLDLSYNNFNLSTIPSGIKSLKELTDLNLTSSNFIGQIPSEILKLSNLVSLDLSSNSLMLQKPSLKDVVETFTHMAELHLSYVTISSPLPCSLSNLTSLSSLLLKNCSLLGEFPPGVVQLPSLRAISLRYNPNLSGYLPEFDNVSNPLELLRLDGTNFSGQLPVSIGNFMSLRVFTVRDCGFEGLIPSSVGNLSNLDTLDLSGNYFSGKIPSSLGNMFRLTYLKLSFNNFSSATLNWVGTLTNLQSLLMSGTNTFGAIPSSLENLTQLTSLWLDDNQLTDQIPSWVGNFTQLTEVDISYNDLQGPIPDLIFRLPNLQNFYVNFNNLSGSLKYDSFLQTEHLVGLQLSGNHLSVVSSPYMNGTRPKFVSLGLGRCNIKEFPAFLRGQNEIIYLDLSSNNIEGYVPYWLVTLESLFHLRLSNNSLTGFELPLSILSFPDLRILRLDSNQFKGPLPFPPLSIVIYGVSQNKFSGHISPVFCKLTSALNLDLSSNNLSGTLPPCFGNHASVLILRNNSLSGAIPNRFTSGCKLKAMDFSRNKFEGKVPHSLAKCSELEILSLDENKMNDVFPSWLGILPRLRVLSLRSNQFHGAIGKPLTPFEFGHLQIIDFSENNFGGKLPVEYFRNWVAMKNIDNDHLGYMQADTGVRMLDIPWNVNYKYSITIVSKGTERSYDRIPEFFVVVDLSSNRFEGEIPDIIGTLRALQLVNLSNNILTGHIPSSLGNLAMLEALDLSQNDLSGQIPVQLTSSTFLAIFNVSHNNLTGPIPKGNQFDTFDNSSFSANPGLCGDILSKKCGNSETLPLPPSENDDEDQKSPFDFNWEIVSIGFGTGIVIGVGFGCALDTRKYEWLVKKKFARRLRRGRRN